MGENSAIAWTDHTFNPWWGCAKVSDGCANCYADTFAKRVGHGARLPTIWGVNADRKIASEATWREPLKWDRAAAAAGQRARVFCSSMADVFEDRPNPRPGYAFDDTLGKARARLWRLIHETPHLDWLLLTKRPENAQRLAIAAWADAFGLATHNDVPDGATMPWLPNIWLGTSVENQDAAERRIPRLLSVPAAVRFLSCEPLLGPLDLRAVRAHGRLVSVDALAGLGPSNVTPRPHVPRLDWVIVGGESGPRARPFALDWARGIVEQCARAEVACFVKQLGSDPFDGTAGCSVILRDPKGGNPYEWPEELRVRQWPEVVRG